MSLPMRLTPLFVALALAWFCHDVTAAGSKQPNYASAEEAAAALIEASKGSEAKEVDTILGPGSDPLVHSGDAVADEKARQHFVAEYEAAHKLVSISDREIELVLGADEWPFPIPLVQDANRWRFDSRAGAEEILRRRIGRNELNAIQVVRAYVDAQREYEKLDPPPNGSPQYAQKIYSDPGSQNGLYWPEEEGRGTSPLGPRVAQARGEGYEKKATEAPNPYHGYLYRMLRAQGPHAPGGALDYIVGGKMTGGFGLVAYPAKYGASGVMTFMVGQDGIVYQKALGPKTAEIAAKMTRFDPDNSWALVP